MNINLLDYDFFMFAWLNTSLGTIEKYLSGDIFFKDNNYRITRNSKPVSQITFEENPEICIVNFLKINNGIVMIPNSQDALDSLFSDISFKLKINGHKIRINTSAGIRYLECCLEKRNFPWMKNEIGEVLSSKEVNDYIDKFKRSWFTKESIIEHLNKLKITKNNILEIDDEENNIITECNKIK